MQETIRKAVLKHYGAEPKDVKELGGGFYGRAFLITLGKEPFLAVLKLYLFSDIVLREADQIRTLSRYAKLKMPEIYGVLEKKQSGLAYDVLFMEYINGANAAYVDAAALPERAAICEDIVDNLIAFHSAVNPNGFGALDSELYCPTWQEYYYPIAKGIACKARYLSHVGQISDRTLCVV